jgi:hypothetical protein
VATPNEAAKALIRSAEDHLFPLYTEAYHKLTWLGGVAAGITGPAERYVADAGAWISAVNGLFASSWNELDAGDRMILGDYLDKIVRGRTIFVNGGISLKSPTATFLSTLPGEVAREVQRRLEELPKLLPAWLWWTVAAVVAFFVFAKR